MLIAANMAVHPLYYPGGAIAAPWQWRSPAA